MLKFHNSLECFNLKEEECEKSLPSNFVKIPVPNIVTKNKNMNETVFSVIVNLILEKLIKIKAVVDFKYRNITDASWKQTN